MYHRIKYWWKFSGKYLFRDIKHGVKNLIKWFPIIWKDRDWDQAYIWSIFRFKLNNQANYIKSNGNHTQSDYDAQRIKLCVKLIDLVSDEWYQLEYADYHKVNFSFKDYDKLSGLKELVFEPVWEKFDDYFKKYPLIYKRVLNGEGPFRLSDNENDRKRLIAMNISHINHERAMNLLFKILRRDIEKWWD